MLLIRFTPHDYLGVAILRGDAFKSPEWLPVLPLSNRPPSFRLLYSWYIQHLSVFYMVKKMKWNLFKLSFKSHCAICSTDQRSINVQPHLLPPRPHQLKRSPALTTGTAASGTLHVTATSPRHTSLAFSQPQPPLTTWTATSWQRQRRTSNGTTSSTTTTFDPNHHHGVSTLPRLCHVAHASKVIIFVIIFFFFTNYVRNRIRTPRGQAPLCLHTAHVAHACFFQNICLLTSMYNNIVTTTTTTITTTITTTTTTVIIPTTNTNTTATTTTNLNMMTTTSESTTTTNTTNTWTTTGARDTSVSRAPHFYHHRLCFHHHRLVSNTAERVFTNTTCFITTTAIIIIFGNILFVSLIFLLLTTIFTYRMRVWPPWRVQHRTHNNRQHDNTQHKLTNTGNVNSTFF